MNMRLTFIMVTALVAAPVLAGCAENGDNPTPTTTPTQTTSGGTTPTGSPTPTGTTPTIPTVPAKDLNLEMTLGIMVPLTGALAHLGEDMRDGALLAVEQINAAGIGITINEMVEDDTTTDTSAATAAFQRLVSQGATAVVGPCCSGITAAVLEAAVQSEIVVATMSATSPALTGEDRENDGYFWRIVPNDNMQGRVLARLVSDEGNDRAVVLTMNNPYGNGLAAVFDEAYDGTIVATERYNEGAQEFSSAVTAVCGHDAGALVMIAYIAEAANIVKEMQRQNCLDKFQIYGPEGMYDQGFPTDAGQDASGNWLAAGVKGTAPAGARGEFKAAFEAKYGHSPGLYAAESYDAVMYVALGALMAESTDSADFRNMLRDIANSGTGKIKVSDFRQAALAILADLPIDYAGAAHDFDFDERHDTQGGIYDVWEVSEDGQMEVVQPGVTA